jgi:hypothetical protein
MQTVIQTKTSGRNGSLWQAATLVATGFLALAGTSGCVVKETRPLPKVHAIQAQAEIPDAYLLDVGVRVLDPGIPKEIAHDTEKMAQQRIYPEVRRAEARFFAEMLRDTLESSGQWGAVRVIPNNAEFVDVIVTGRILESSGKEMAIELSVLDSTGRKWIDAKTGEPKKYKSPADVGSYLTEEALRLRDPFQNVYSVVANDMLTARNLLQPADLANIRRVTELRFASDLAPQVFSGYLAQDEAGIYRVARLPAEGDTLLERIQRIRERDGALIDTVSDYYTSFSDSLSEPYGNWRRYSYEEIVKEEKLKAQARTRLIMGAVAVAGAILMPGQCSGGDYNCRRIENAARTGAVSGGIAGILSGLKKKADAQIHTAAIRELANSFQSEVAPQVVEVEGRTLKLAGTAEDQYREWREMLKQIYLEETGGVNVQATAPAPEPAPATTTR